MSGRSPRRPGCGRRAGVPIVALDIGGGFPGALRPRSAAKGAAARPTPPALIAEVVREAEEWGFDDVPLIAEPGRVIVARVLLADRARAPAEGPAHLHQ